MTSQNHNLKNGGAYSAPTIEVLSVLVEQGIAFSTPNSTITDPKQEQGSWDVQ